MRHQTGLRNRYRHGKGRYAKARKSRDADRYGQFDKGKRLSDDIIGGHALSYKFIAMEGN